ncbi:hypothetical protein [Acrocarpospora sp. B8E8]
MFKGIFVLGVSSYGMSNSADLIELIEGDSGAPSHGEDEGEEAGPADTVK